MHFVKNVNQKVRSMNAMYILYHIICEQSMNITPYLTGIICNNMTVNNMYCITYIEKNQQKLNISSKIVCMKSKHSIYGVMYKNIKKPHTPLSWCTGP